MIVLAVRDVYELKGDVREAVKGICEGIKVSAVEGGLNLEAALNEAAWDTVDAAAEQLSQDFSDEVREAVSREFRGVKITLPGKQ